MTEMEKENWECVWYRMREEGIDYCFDGYSHWKEIKDKEFHRLRQNFLNAMSQLEGYVETKVDEARSS